MALTPLLFLAYDKLVLRRCRRLNHNARSADVIDADAVRDNPVIIAGFGRIGHVVSRMLRAQGIGATVLDLDPEHVELIRKLGMKVFYGDATRLELLQAAGAARARLFVVAIDQPAKSLELVDTIKKHFPNLELLVRAEGRVHAYELHRRGVRHFHREMLGSGVRMGEDALRLLGFRAHQAYRAGRIFQRHDEAAVLAMAEHWGDEERYLSEARKGIAAFEKMFEADRAAPPVGEAWHAPSPDDRSRG